MKTRTPLLDRINRQRAPEPTLEERLPEWRRRATEGKLPPRVEYPR